MSKAPVVSWKKVAKLAESLGYEFIRQNGDHKRYEIRVSQDPLANAVTIPEKNPVHPKTLDRILRTISSETGISKKDLKDRLNRL